MVCASDAVDCQPGFGAIEILIVSVIVFSFLGILLTFLCCLCRHYGGAGDDADQGDIEEVASSEAGDVDDRVGVVVDRALLACRLGWRGRGEDVEAVLSKGEKLLAKEARNWCRMERESGEKGDNRDDLSPVTPATVISSLTFPNSQSFSSFHSLPRGFHRVPFPDDADVTLVKAPLTRVPDDRRRVPSPTEITDVCCRSDRRDQSDVAVFPRRGRNRAASSPWPEELEPTEEVAARSRPSTLFFLGDDDEDDSSRRYRHRSGKEAPRPYPPSLSAPATPAVTPEGTKGDRRGVMPIHSGTRRHDDDASLLDGFMERPSPQSFSSTRKDKSVGMGEGRRLDPCSLPRNSSARRADRATSLTRSFTIDADFDGTVPFRRDRRRDRAQIATSRPSNLLTPSEPRYRFDSATNFASAGSAIASPGAGRRKIVKTRSFPDPERRSCRPPLQPERSLIRGPERFGGALSVPVSNELSVEKRSDPRSRVDRHPPAQTRRQTPHLKSLDLKSHSQSSRTPPSNSCSRAHPQPAHPRSTRHPRAPLPHSQCSRSGITSHSAIMTTFTAAADEDSASEAAVSVSPRRTSVERGTSPPPSNETRAMERGTSERSPDVADNLEEDDVSTTEVRRTGRFRPNTSKPVSRVVERVDSGRMEPVPAASRNEGVFENGIEEENGAEVLLFSSTSSEDDKEPEMNELERFDTGFWEEETSNGRSEVVHKSCEMESKHRWELPL